MDDGQFEELCKKLKDPQMSELNLEYSVFDGDESKVNRFVDLLKESNIKWINLKKTGLGVEGVAKLLSALKDRGGSTTHVKIAEGFSKEDIEVIARSAGLMDKLALLGGEPSRHIRGRSQTREVSEIEGTIRGNSPNNISAKQKQDKQEQNNLAQQIGQQKKTVPEKMTRPRVHQETNSL